MKCNFIRNNLIYILTSISLLINIILINLLIKKTKIKYIKKESYEINKNDYEVINKGIEINSYYKLVDDIKIIEEDESKFEKLTEVHIATVTSNEYLYPSLVSMTSSLENCDKSSTLLHYHILMKDNFNEDKINIFKSLKFKYKNNIKLSFYNMSKLFNNLKDHDVTNYYKLVLPRLFPNIKRMIYLDPDTLIYKDILEMYNLNFQGYFILGFPYPYYELFDDLNIYSVIYINTGVMLMNLDELRNEDLDIKVIEFALSNNLKYPVQDSLNYILYPNVGLLPFNYGVSIYGDQNSLQKNLFDKIRTRHKIDKIKHLLEDPSIVHFIESEPKIWFLNSTHIFGHKYYKYIKKYQNDFYYYANKTDYGKKIYNLFMK